jgi:hypothetical protein
MVSYHTKFLDSKRPLLESTKRVSLSVLDSIKSSILAVFNDRAISGSASEALRILSSFDPQTDEERLSRSMILLSAYRAEQLSPVSGYLFLKLLSGKKILQGAQRRMVEDDLQSLLSTINDQTVESLLTDAIYQSGSAGNVSVTTGGITHISVDENASFHVIISPSFVNAKSLTSRKIIAYDGVIESVGQINSFLERCSKEKARILLIARSFSSEVASTIYANNQRGNFDIVPLTPTLGIDGEFTIADIAAISGQKQTSKICLDESGEECNVVVEGSTLKIALTNLRFRDDLLKKLRKELVDFSNFDVSQLLSQRIARISSRRVSVCIGDEFGDSKEIMKEKFDYGMRCYLSSRRKGVTEVDGQILPGESTKIANLVYESFKKLLNSTGGALVIDNEMEKTRRRISKRK